jgi:hypothetical protein
MVVDDDSGFKQTLVDSNRTGMEGFWEGSNIL